MRAASHVVEGFLKTLPHIGPINAVAREIPAARWMLYAELHRASEEGDTALMAVIDAQIEASFGPDCTHCGCDLATAAGAEHGLCGDCIDEIDGGER